MAAEFQNLELTPKDTFCFGFCPVKPVEGHGGDRSWYKIAMSSVTLGWKNVDIERIDEDLATNVDATYGFLCQTVLNDLDSGMRYKVVFENDSSMWKVGLVGSPNAEILPEQAKALFSSEYFLKFASRCGVFISRAVKCFRNVLEPKFEEGQLLKVSAPKLARILWLAENDHTMENLRTGKFRLT